MKDDDRLEESEAWLWLAALSEACPDYMANCSGLCSATFNMLHSMAVSSETFHKMRYRIESHLKRHGRRYAFGNDVFVFFDKPYRWKGGTRTDWCLRFARSSKNGKKAKAIRGRCLAGSDDAREH